MFLRPLILLVLSALTLAMAAGASMAWADEPAVTTCSLPEGWAEIARRQPRYVVFGELHGTQQSPAFIGNLACALASRKQRVLVAIEQNARDNAALQDAWRLPTARFGQALRLVGWIGRKDGIASEAMFGMVVHLHALKTTGLPIDIVAFNSDSAQEKHFPHLAGQGAHEAAQAENIHAATIRGRYDQVLILVGNVHARRARHGEGAGSFDFMAARLAALGRVVTLNTRYAAGTAWNCLAKPGVTFTPGHPPPSDAIECGNHSVKSNSDLKRAPFIGLGAFPGEEPDTRYDGFFWLGPISGSPPLLPGE
ncbi:MAG: hypothetical protein K0R64_439 [Novosphingobium lindaniclasticum]|nr:hypothetical protein [Novosphingobium lindaniclasticum]